VYDLLWEAGQPHAIVNAGYRAIDRLRVEKGYVYWSTDVTPDTTPLEAGLAWRIDWDKGDFCGRAALVAQRTAGVTRALSTFTIELESGQMTYPVGGEAILLDDRVVGFTTTANFGDTVGKPVLYGYVPVEHLERDDWVIEVYGEQYRANRHDRCVYDPAGRRLRA
jgi:4-methylaminobutanoate oxidase (formaldehyde-forming)